MIIRFLITIIILLFCPINLVHAQPLSFSEQASSWTGYEDKRRDKFDYGIRYIPELMLEMPLSDGKMIDTSIAVNAYTYAYFNSIDDTDDNADAEFYRLWVRYSSDRLEARAGLQKINFGSAKVLRSLKWFDHIDPEDPLELTDGVCALLMRYYSVDNSNLWLWVVDGDDELKGLEAYPTDENKPEYGGRYQLAVQRGEIALSYNQREIDSDKWGAVRAESLDDGTQERYALDGNFDITVGAWFEAVTERIMIDAKNDEWRNMLTLGIDYTIDSGVYFMCEHFVQSSGKDIDNTAELIELSAITVSYAITMIDTLKGIIYYDHKAGRGYYYADWQRTYDNWQMNLSSYNNGESDEPGGFRGYGIQGMLTFNH